jgi:hypothetical protein
MDNSLVGKRVRVIGRMFDIDGDIMYEPYNPGDCYILNNVTKGSNPDIKLGNGIRIQNFDIMYPYEK